MKSLVALVLAAAGSLAPAQVSCPGNGLTLATTPPRLGDP